MTSIEILHFLLETILAITLDINVESTGLLSNWVEILLTEHNVYIGLPGYYVLNYTDWYTVIYIYITAQVFCGFPFGHGISFIPGKN